MHKLRLAVRFALAMLATVVAGLLIQPGGSVRAWSVGPGTDRPISTAGAIETARGAHWGYRPLTALITISYSGEEAAPGQAGQPCAAGWHVTAHSLFGIPVERVRIGCGGTEIGFG
jgi:hypothetical protein